MQHSPKIQENIDFIKDLYSRGIDQCLKSSVPHPEKLPWTKPHAPILAVTPILVLVTTNDKLVEDRKSRRNYDPNTGLSKVFEALPVQAG